MLMTREPDWPKFMNDQEREELAMAERVRDAAGTQLRILKRRIKDRCLKRKSRVKND